MEYLPARTLAYLLERQDEVVTRLELVQLLWPHETHGDFTHRLDKVIHKLRAALRDDPSAPVYIQTLRGCGFRFIGGKSIDRPRQALPCKALENPESIAPEP
jgi:DNA-binding winged helix-turn-helix (wHTH) protein